MIPTHNTAIKHMQLVLYVVRSAYISTKAYRIMPLLTVPVCISLSCCAALGSGFVPVVQCGAMQVDLHIYASVWRMPCSANQSLEATMMPVEWPVMFVLGTAHRMVSFSGRVLHVTSQRTSAFLLAYPQAHTACTCHDAQQNHYQVQLNRRNKFCCPSIRLRILFYLFISSSYLAEVDSHDTPGRKEIGLQLASD